jgi:hypothetical protein
LSEFKFCSFKRFLPKALRLNFDYDNILKLNNEHLKKSNKNELLYNHPNDKKFVDSIKMERNNSDNLVVGLDIHEPLTEKKLNDEQNFDTNFDKLVLIENKNVLDIENNLMKENVHDQNNDSHMIDFSKFCNILKIFNSSFPVDLKIKCKRFHLSIIIFKFILDYLTLTGMEEFLKMTSKHFSKNYSLRSPNKLMKSKLKKKLRF